jgi:hypothetical protein
MIKKIILLKLLFVFSLFYSCTSNSAEKIINETIAVHGGKFWKQAEIKFTFRDKQYTIKNDAERFEYSELTTDSLGDSIKSVLNNNGFKIYRNNNLTEVDEGKKLADFERLNSVVYFASIPFNLNDKAVIKKYLGESRLKKESYHKIEINFRKEGGGNDFDDTFLYWINTETKKIDYFAYKYLRNGGGSRFRKLVNARLVSGIFVADNKNYKAKEKIDQLEDYEKLLIKNELIDVSDILIENVRIKL